MKKILLVCNAGMSTSILVEKMKEVAAAENIESKIWATSSSEAKEMSEEVDVVLIGPQLKFALDDVKASFPGIPVEVIDRRIYGMIDGKGALDRALELVK